jgi:hypothetical protein
MNGVTPFLNRLLPKKYGFVAPRKKGEPMDSGQGLKGTVEQSKGAAK